MFLYLADETPLTSGAALPFDESDLDNWFLENKHGKNGGLLVLQFTTKIRKSSGLND